MRLRDRSHDALVGQDVVGALRSKRLARIKEEADGDEDGAEADLGREAKERAAREEEKEEDTQIDGDSALVAESKDTDLADMDTD